MKDFDTVEAKLASYETVMEDGWMFLFILVRLNCI